MPPTISLRSTKLALVYLMLAGCPVMQPIVSNLRVEMQAASFRWQFMTKATSQGTGQVDVLQSHGPSSTRTMLHYCPIYDHRVAAGVTGLKLRDRNHLI